MASFDLLQALYNVAYNIKNMFNLNIAQHHTFPNWMFQDL
jgi:hypothetical protein